MNDWDEYGPEDAVELSDEPTEDEVDASLVAEGAQSVANASLADLDVEVERRFEVAMYYRTLLKDPLFNEATEASRVVENEVRAFIRNRLEELMGIKAPTPVAVQKSPFDAEEILALKAVAKRLVKKPDLIDAKPALRKAQPPPPAPVRAPPTVAARRSPIPGSKPPAAPVKQAPKPTVQNKENGIVTDTGKVLQKGTKRYKIVENDLGTQFKQDITVQLRPNNCLPTPSPEMMEQITASQASKQVASLDRTAQRVAIQSASQGQGE